MMANAFSQDRYQVWRYENRGPWRFKVIDTEMRGRIAARCAGKESAERIAKQLNEKGYVHDA